VLARPLKTWRGATQSSMASGAKSYPDSLIHHTTHEGKPTMPDAREQIQAAMDALNIKIEAVFVPWSNSRNFKKGAKPSERSLNWYVILIRNGREILSTDYMQGIGYAPAYKRITSIKHGWTVPNTDALIRETEQGVTRDKFGKASPLLPEPVDVVASLVLDCSVLDCGGFEDWAAEYGFDADPRKAEAIYRQCLEIALKLRAAVGEDGLNLLREACAEW
jgi:hypothetical protein